MTPPANVSSLTATPGDTTVSLSWTDPGDPDLAGTKIVQKTGGYPSGPFDGTTVYSGMGVSVVDTGLTNGVTYFYGAYAFDTHGNFASGALANATPSGPPPPVPPTPTSTPPTPPGPPTTTPPAPPTPPTPPTAPVPPNPPTVPTPGQPAQAIFPVFYYGNGGTVQLIPDAAGQIHTLSGSAVLVSVPVAGLGNIPSTLALFIGTSQYSLARSADGLTYSGIFTAPSAGTYLSTVRVTFQNNTTADSGQTIVLHPSGAIVEEGLSGPSTVAVSGASVQLFRDVQGTWTPAGPPFTTADSGSYGYVVQNGRYYIEVTRDGYLKNVTAPFSINANFINQVIGLIKVPVKQPLPEQPVARAVAIVQQASDQVSYGVKIARATLNSPQVQAANTVAGPVILAMTLSNSATAINFFNLLAYLQYLFTQPLLLFGRMRKRKWGVVFNSLTKQPVDLAIIRLVHFETKLVIQTRVTDKLGRYWFLAKKGNYLLEVVKPGYVYPTTYLANKAEDVEFVDLYHGSKLELQEGEVIAMNIPVDPVVSEETPTRVIARKFARVLRHSLAFSGVLLGMIVLVVSPNVVSALLLLAQIGVYLLFRRLALPAKPKSWGITFDAKTRKPLSGAIIRIFEKKFNKLLETQVTDANGKYGFFVRRNVFFLTVEKPGYKKYVSKDIDLSTKEEAVVDQNVSLEPL